MSEERQNGVLARSQQTGKARRPYRRGKLSQINRFMGRLPTMAAALLLTGFAVVLAILFNWILGKLGLIGFDRRILLASVIVTVLVGFPIIVYALLIIRELNSSRRTLRQMTERLAWALDNAERANEAKSHFLANMSHELRTPLNAIIGFSDILRNERFGAVGDPRYREYAADINDSGVHLLGIINDILDLAKIDSGHASTSSETEFEVAAVLESAERMVRLLAERGKVDFVVQRPDFDIRLVGVERMVRQILVNVLSNAVKFTEPGGAVYLVTSLRNSGALVVSVTDTGIGMTHEEIKVALTPFGQTESALSRKHQGTGLGLPLAKAMMELHGGRLLVRSAPGKGTSIILIFPPERVRAAGGEKAISQVP